MPRPFTRNRNRRLAYHVFNQGRRGADGRPQRIFRDREDRQFFLSLFSRHLCAEPKSDRRGRLYRHVRERLMLFAYCVMTTHFHLIVWQRDERAIADLMHSVTVAYTNHFKRKYGVAPPVYNGPVRAKEITSPRYLKWLVAYVHNNHPDGLDYEFSSHRAWTDTRHRPGWLEPDPALAAFGGVDNYRAYLDQYRRKRSVDVELGFSKNWTRR